MSAVRVVWIDLDGWDGDASILSPDEGARAARFIAEPARRAFCACRVVLRRVLGEAMGIAPASVPLRLAPSGKPSVEGGPDFNLSHSGPWGVVALGAGPLGVDVEELRPLDDVPALARSLAATERARVVAAPDPSQAFLRLWVVKEAVLKGQGHGIAGGLDTFSVADHPWIAGQSVRLDGRPAAGWSAAPLASPSGTVAALAWTGPAPALDAGHWRWD